MRAGELSAGHARCLLPLEDSARIEGAAAFVCEKQMSVRQAEQLVKELLAPPQKKKEKPPAPVEIREAQNKLSEALETKVMIHGTLHRGHIAIEYYNKEQLEGLFEYLKKP